MLSQFMYSLLQHPAQLLDDNFIFSFLQLGVLLTFLITAVRAWRFSPSRLRELFTAAIFGLLLEEGDIIIFGTYSYNAHWLSIGFVPIAIGLTWAMIAASAMNFSDALGLPSLDDPKVTRPRSLSGTLRWLARGSIAPVADAVWATVLDLALDAVAIRLKLWTWNIGLDQGWFGVPWGNFYSWLFVVAMFSFFTRLVRRREAERGTAQGWWQLAVPFAAYGGLLAAIVPFEILEVTIFVTNRQGTWPIFLFTLASFVGVTLYGLWNARLQPREEPDRWLLFLRIIIHLNFLAAIFVTGIFLQLPILLWVSLTMLAVELGGMYLSHRAGVTRRGTARIGLTMRESRAE